MGDLYDMIADVLFEDFGIPNSRAANGRPG